MAAADVLAPMDWDSTAGLGGLRPRLEPPRDAVAEQVQAMWSKQMDALSHALAKQMQPVLEAAKRRRLEENQQQQQHEASRAAAVKFDAPGAARRINYGPYFDKFRDHIEELWEDYAQQAYVPPIEFAFSDPLYDHRGMRGDEVLALMRRVAQTFPDPPTPPQWKIIEGSFCAMGALIFGDEWHVDRQSILDRQNWVDYHGILAVLTPRKFGKTTCLAYIVIMVLFCIAGAKVLVVSRTRGQASICLDMVRSLIRVHPLFSKWDIQFKDFCQTKITIVCQGSERTVEVRSGDASVRLEPLFFPPACVRVVPWHTKENAAECSRLRQEDRDQPAGLRGSRVRVRGKWFASASFFFDVTSRPRRRWQRTRYVWGFFAKRYDE